MSKILAPLLRFPEFDSAWASSITGELCDTIVPGRNKPKVFDGDIPWITTPDIAHNGVIRESRDGLSISKEVAKTIGSRIVPPKSVVMSCVGDLGLVAYTGNEIVINQQLHAFLPYEQIYWKFLLYALSTRKRYMERVATTTAVPYLNKSNCNSVPIAYPSLSEQRKIAGFLTAIDAKLQALRRKRALLADYKRGLMQQLFSQQRRFTQPNGLPFPPWKATKLGKIAKVVGGGTPATARKSYWNGQINWFTPTEIKQKYLQGSQRRISQTGLEKSSAKLLPVGTLLLTSRASIGDVGIALKPCATNQGFQNLIVNEKNHNEFWYYWLLHNQKELLRRASGSTFREISRTEVAKIRADKPELEEQHKIAGVLTAIDDKITAVDHQIAHIETFKKGLLQQMFV